MIHSARVRVCYRAFVSISRSALCVVDHFATLVISLFARDVTVRSELQPSAVPFAVDEFAFARLVPFAVATRFAPGGVAAVKFVLRERLFDRDVSFLRISPPHTHLLVIFVLAVFPLVTLLSFAAVAHVGALLLAVPVGGDVARFAVGF